MAVHRQVRGKQAELVVLEQLLRRGLVPYTPAADVEGIDAIVKTQRGTYLGLQIKSKSRAAKHPRWFQVQNLPKGVHFIVCVEESDGTPKDVWVLPAQVFDKVATRPPRGSPRDLNLDVGSNKYGEPLKDILAVFRDNWDLITSYEKYRSFFDNLDDLEDVLAMAETLAAPEEETSSLEAYLAKRERHVPRQNT